MRKIITTLLTSMSLAGCIEMPKTVEHDSNLTFTQLDGYRFHTVIKGQSHSPVVIIVHGGPGADHQYLTSLSPLSKTHRVIFYDQRGSGLSPRVDSSQLTIAQNIADLNLLVEHFSATNKVKLIGHSWGAMLVSGYMSTYPEKVSHAVLVEPGMLTPESAKAFINKMNEFQSLSTFFSVAKYMSVYPLVKKNDGKEGFDYVMTKLLNQNTSGAPYQCETESLPANAFVRGGYDAFNSMLKPVMENPALFSDDLTDGIKNYTGHLMMISSECSEFGYAFQEQFHQPQMPKQTIHIKAKKMGHYMLTLNPQWSLVKINPFLAK
ncbi:alpha/beta hydrolase [Psychromonas sp. psych-6C06]|uniref:alpha/beta fold hydrolase n=1 Tax=Psychromonas sp. psych-6C06 TaxID=2058089 RepID=UPI00187C0D0E|nr:alpha/beta hydrolase [Psychromonas sp. psych-6C06]